MYGINLFRCALLVACGVLPMVPDRNPKPFGEIVGVQLYQSQHEPSLHAITERPDGKVSAVASLRLQHPILPLVLFLFLFFLSLSLTICVCVCLFVFTLHISLPRTLTH